MKNSLLIKQINLFFSSNKHNIGSRKRLSNLLNNLPQFENGKLNYLIAGSWAIEILSGKKLKHDDIDLIIIQEPLHYIDDAEEIEEKCFGIIPLDQEYFENNNFIKRNFERREVYVPNHNFQICIKLVGQLQKFLPERAITQLEALLSTYKNFDKLSSIKEIKYLLEKWIPEDLNCEELAKKIVNAIENYVVGKKLESIEEFKQIHAQINKSLRNQFEMRGLTKKIKISEK